MLTRLGQISGSQKVWMSGLAASRSVNPVHHAKPSLFPNTTGSKLMCAIQVRSYSEAKKPKRVKIPSVLWVKKQADKRKWKLEQKKDTELNLPEHSSAKTLGSALGVRAVDIVKKLIKMNEPPTSSDQFLNNDLVDMVVADFGRVPVRGRDMTQDIYPRNIPANPSIYPPRAPVVAIMGHVDHGKTTLLDSLRGSSIAENEHGGITQRMASFSVKVPGSAGPVTFIDTPGHAAFAKMRQRGADVTDIAVLVVAADEGVQEQTEQAIQFIQDSGCEMVVALNKCDKRNADPEKVRLQLNARGIHMAKYGGDVMDVEISALEGDGLEELQETILYCASEMGLYADPKGPGEAEVMDVKREDYRGVVACCVMRLGSIQKGDAMIAGSGYGKVKHIYDEHGKMVKSIAPGMPFEVTGWEVTPQPGDELLIVSDLAKAKSVAAVRKSKFSNTDSDKVFARRQRMEFMEKETEQKDKLQAVELGLDPAKFIRKQQRLREHFKIKDIPLFLKADSGGSIEAIKDSLQILPSDEVRLTILRAEVGIVAEQDVKEAAMLEPKAIVVGFNTTFNNPVKELAHREGVTVGSFKLIYGFMDWIRGELGKHLKPREHVKILAEADVVQIFPVTIRRQVVYIAGCQVNSGIFKKRLCQVVRNGTIMWEGSVRSLRHMKEEAKEITSGKECGIMLSGDPFELLVGDVIQNIEKSYHARVLGEPLVTKGAKTEPEDL